MTVASYKRFGLIVIAQRRLQGSTVDKKKEASCAVVSNSSKLICLRSDIFLAV